MVLIPRSEVCKTVPTGVEARSGSLGLRLRLYAGFEVRSGSYQGKVRVIGTVFGSMPGLGVRSGSLGGVAS